MGLLLILLGVLVLASIGGAADLDTAISLTEITVRGLLGLALIFVGVIKEILAKD